MCGQGQGKGASVCETRGYVCMCLQDYMSLCLCAAGEGWEVPHLWKLCCVSELVLWISCMFVICSPPSEQRLQLCPGLGWEASMDE